MVVVLEVKTQKEAQSLALEVQGISNLSWSAWPQRENGDTVFTSVMWRMALNHQGASEAPKGEAQAKYVGEKVIPKETVCSPWSWGNVDGFFLLSNKWSVSGGLGKNSVPG